MDTIKARLLFFVPTLNVSHNFIVNKTFVQSYITLHDKELHYPEKSCLIPTTRWHNLPSIPQLSWYCHSGWLLVRRPSHHKSAFMYKACQVLSECSACFLLMEHWQVPQHPQEVFIPRFVCLCLQCASEWEKAEGSGGQQKVGLPDWHKDYCYWWVTAQTGMLSIIY